MVRSRSFEWPVGQGHSWEPNDHAGRVMERQAAMPSHNRVLIGVERTFPDTDIIVSTADLTA